MSLSKIDKSNHVLLMLEPDFLYKGEFNFEGYIIRYIHYNSKNNFCGYESFNEIPKVFEKTSQSKKPYCIMGTENDPGILFITIGKRYGQSLPFSLIITNEKNEDIEWRNQGGDIVNKNIIFILKVINITNEKNPPFSFEDIKGFGCTEKEEKKTIQLSFSKYHYKTIKPVNPSVSIIFKLSMKDQEINPLNYIQAKSEINNFLREICQSDYFGHKFIITSDLPNPLNFCIGTLWKPNIFGDLTLAFEKDDVYHTFEI